MFLWVHPAPIEFLIWFWDKSRLFFLLSLSSFFSVDLWPLWCGVVYFKFRTFAHCFLSSWTMCDKLTTSYFSLWSISLFFFSVSITLFWRKLGSSFIHYFSCLCFQLYSFLYSGLMVLSHRLFLKLLRLRVWLCGQFLHSYQLFVILFWLRLCKLFLVCLHVLNKTLDETHGCVIVLIKFASFCLHSTVF